ncbi:hypothetical protein C7451_103151 [Blastomonas natatoria]|uniref:Filamentous hemagglutinin family protein n=1 Tax=Blastomonas natatoria TaxID=34015 RepID=A0A2V3V8F0_9SPHN|nr:hypothetical protein [Blastomonas natatoria]PXW78043.1 hypothetical protein C7451_103151 [Blastomonas natatoria]
MAYDRTLTARRILLAKATSALALATGLAIGGSGPAHGQAFEGTPTVVSGGAGINRTPGTDNIRVDTDQAVINWTTNDTAIGGGVINFLPNGRTAFFRNNPTIQNQFTVLNRIIPNDPNRAIALNGTIISQLQTGAGLVSGGNVYFYSPGGIVIGSTGVIDVGGLLLTSLDPVRDGSGNFITAGGALTLGPAASATSYVQVDTGAQITLTPQNSYVAMVSPIIRQNGSVNVNGSAAYVGAEAATITFAGNGLFDIQVTTGTNGDAAAGNTAIAHNGSTTGPASSGAGDNHRIYMVAVPKNNAITMAIGGGSTLGFDIAGAADVQGNSIILSSGFNVSGDTIDQAPANPGQQASLFISSGTITSAINGASSFLTNVAVGSGTLSLAGDARFHGDNQSTVTAFGTGQIIASRDLTVSADRVGLTDGQSVTGGNAQLYAQAGGTVRVLGNAFVTANGEGGGNLSGGAVGAGVGGIADVRSFGNSLLDIAGNLVVSADGRAGSIGSTSTTSNSGTGGTVIVTSGRNATIDNNSTMLIGGNLLVTANGFGSSNFGNGTAGIGQGGSVQINSGASVAGGSNNALTVNGIIFGSADGFGGSAFGTGSGGAGLGGNIGFSAGTGGQINATGPVTLTSFGFGGNADDSDGNGGNGTGGSALAQIFATGGVLSLASDLTIQATGVGGNSGVGVASTGGTGRGGLAQLSLSAFALPPGGTVTVQGQVQIEALGLGGNGVFGGNGFGGALVDGRGALLTMNNAGTMTLNGGVRMSSGGIGGSATTSGTGGSGNGTGGTTQIVASGTGGTINITGLVDIDANGAVFGSSLTGIDGGDGRGGAASISQELGGLITINGDAIVSATGTGDSNTGGGDGIAGSGFGGDARIVSNRDTVTITGNASVDARGTGGFNNGGIRAGNGTGGIANIGAGASGAAAGFATMSIGGNATVTADGTGGTSFGTGSGGDGFGGQAIIGAIEGGVIQIGSFVDATAQGFGGDAAGTGNLGGEGGGGAAQLFAGARAVVTVGGITAMNASGFGGSASAGANSGAAVGGFADVSNGTGNGQITLGQDVFLSSQGLSGNVVDGGGNAGTAAGGTSRMRASGTGSAITVNGNVFADAIAGTGSAVTGTIGDATGGIVDLSVGSGTLNITGAASLDASAFGGNSILTGNGGNATGGRTLVVNTNEGNGFITIAGDTTMVANGTGGTAQTGNGGTGTGGRNELGTINIQSTQTYGGIVSLTATGQGGSALLAGNGGAGIGGDSRFGSNNTQLRGGDVFISAIGRGGDGALGGNGGDATGGFALLISDTGLLAGLVDLDNVSLSVDAFGGAGGAGANGLIGGAGGAGGNATAGDIQAFGAAGNGVLDIGNLQISANGFGGAGGAGGTGSSGLGGAGGAGGNGIGGFNQFGTISSVTNGADNSGSALMLDVFSQAAGFGGSGGTGGSGSTGAGNGGAGGSGEGGRNALLVRGSRVALNNATLVSDGFGGNGGAGATSGAGGNGIGGTVGFLITDRFQIPANRGRLEANDLLGIAGGVGGSGSVAGQSLFARGSNVEVRNADAIVGSLVVNAVGNAPSAGPDVEDFIRVSDGFLNVAGSLTYVTPNRLSVLVSNGAVNAGTFGINTGDFVNDTVITSPTSLGTITAGAISLLSSNNVIVGANLATPGDFSAVASGAIILGNINAGGVIGMQGTSLQLGNLTSGNHVNLTSTSGGISAGVVTAADFIAMTAANGLTLSTATATNGYIDLLVNAGNMTIGNLTAGTYIVLDTRAGNMALGGIQSGEDTELSSTGSVSFADASTGLDFSVTALGDITGNSVNASGAIPTTSYSVGLLSQGGSIQVGNLTGARNIGLVAGGTISAGSLTSGENIVALGTGNILINGAVTTGTAADRYFYVGNTSMVASLGPDFDPTPLFALTPVRTAGNLVVNGPIQASNVLAGVGTAFSASGAITATGGRVGISANSIAAQAISSGLFTFLETTNGNLAVGNVSAGGAVTLQTSSGLLTSGTLTGSLVTVDGGGAVSIGGVTTTGAAQLRSRTASFASTGPITASLVNIGGTAVTLGNVTSTSSGISIGATGGNLGFGTLSSATSTQFNVAGSVTGGDITAGTSIGTIVTGDMTLGNLRTTGPGATSTGFSIGLGANGAIVTGTINSFGLLGIGSDDGLGNFGNASNITTGAITAGGTVLVRANQAIATGNISSTNEIRVRGGSITAGALNATNAVFAAAINGSLTTGNVSAGTNALLLASQNVTAGSIATGNPATGASGTVLVSGSSGISPTAAISAIDLNALLTATPVRAGGNVSIGAVSTGSLVAASTGTLSANSTITAGTRISLDAGGTAVFGGLAVAPTITISSGDIAFSANGGLGNANTGTITLTANRSGSIVIGGAGDNQSQQTGYTLDGSEISRIRAQSIVINAPNVSSTGTGVEIRALTLNGSTATSGTNLNGAEGSLTINTPGTIRVNGNAVFNAMAAANRVSLNAGRVEINADTGGIFLSGSSPGGVLSINANNIHVASASLLERLADNVNFVGRDTALSLPIAASRPDGVIQASTLQFTVGITLFIQNTGTSLLNAGFFGRVGSFQVTPRSSQQGSSSLIDLVIYGQLLDTGDLVRNGTSVRDLIFPRSTSSTGQDSGGPSGFTATSSINGCLLSAIACGGGGITEQSPTVISHAGPPPPTPAAEREAQQEQEEAEAAAEEAARGEAAPRKPIMPPVTIVNTRRLGVEPIIDEPVTSGGNPNLQLDQPLTDPLPDSGGQP